MKFTIRGMAVAAGLLGSAAFVLSQTAQLPQLGSDEVLLRAMRDELARMPQLAKVGGKDAPYYASYMVSDADTFNVSSTLGATISANRNAFRAPAVERAYGAWVRGYHAKVDMLFSLLLVAGDPRIRGGIDYPEKEPGVFELTGVVSRKKQLLPYLSQLLRTLA